MTASSASLLTIPTSILLDTMLTEVTGNAREADFGQREQMSIAQTAPLS